MGEVAQSIFAMRGILVTCGAPVDTPENLVALYTRGEIISYGNACNHDHEGHTRGGH